MLTLILFFIGFGLLIKGADLLVSGASSIALKFNIPAIVVGLTIVAFGTSTPELSVNLFSALDGKTDLAIGNIIGSNIANILLILGAAALIYPLSAQKNTVWKELPFAFLALFVVGLMANDVLLDGAASNLISRSDGLVLIGFFAIFLIYTFGIAQSTQDMQQEAQGEIFPLGKSLAYIIIGLTGLTLGGKWIVDGAVELANIIGMSEAVIGLTVVAVGTSLPELATSIVAALKKQSDIAIGNVVGSNIFNIFWILGFTAVIQPLPFQAASSNRDVLVCIAVTILLFACMFLGKRFTLERWQGGVMIGLYILYITYLVIQSLA